MITPGTRKPVAVQGICGAAINQFIPGSIAFTSMIAQVEKRESFPVMNKALLIEGAPRK
jgi:hypothetical protein